LRAAVERIDALTPVLARSRIYETAPVGGPSQPDYLNAAVLIDWPGDPHALLDALQTIEHDLGRVRDVRNGPRTIDLDILWMQDARIESARLVVPHPRLHERAFALRPLLDIAPDATTLPTPMERESSCRISHETLS